MLMRRIARATVLVAICILVAGCASRTSTPIRKAPLPPEEEADLRQTLAGETWGVEYVTKTPDMHNRKKKKSQLKWAFNADGTGQMTQKIAENVPMVGGQTKSGPFRWKLQGKNLILTTGNQKQYFRVETWSDKQMMWLNYSGSNYFIVYPVD